MGTLHTDFAPAERAGQGILARQSRLLADQHLVQQLFDSVSEIILILNQQRQIVFCNRRFAELAGLPDAHAVYGMRPGEALGCVHAADGQGGCGTADFCSACGAVRAILGSQNGQEEVQEARVLRNGQAEALDLLVRATPMQVDGDTFTIFAVTDVSHQKRRRALERIFFHDVLNTASGLRMLSAMLARDASKTPRIAASIDAAVNRMVDEIAGQRDLMAAESRDLAIRPQALSAKAVLESLAAECGLGLSPAHCRVRVAAACRDATFTCDHTALSRVLCNLVKNAVEASKADQAVTLSCGPANDAAAGGEGVEFLIHNEQAMDRQVQLQVFQRSFSTKGSGRGLGTYSVKLLTERYLRGRVSFTSTPENGTTFRIWLPVA